MKSAKSKERRRKKRWQVAVLVRMSFPKFDGEIFELEMWAKDVNAKGLKLEWSRGLSVSQLKKEQKKDAHIRFEDISFKKGDHVKIQDLFYDDEGSPFIEGKILWARKTGSQDMWTVGIGFDDPKKQSKELIGAFKDFLSVVKNPVQAIEKASRKG